MSDVTVRPYHAGDAEPIMDLYHANTADAVADRADGFVQGGMSLDKITQLAATGRVFVATADQAVLGFVFSGWPQPTPTPTAYGELVRLAPECVFEGRSVGATRWITYGPIVVASSSRGRGVGRALFEAVRAGWAGEAQVCVLFVDESNQRSLRVHLDGFGMTAIGHYAYAASGYTIAAFALPAAG